MVGSTKTLMIKIETDIPVPMNAGTCGPNTVYPLKEMSVGDSFFVANKRSIVVASAVWHHGKRYGKKFCTRKVDGGVRVWRIA